MSSAAKLRTRGIAIAGATAIVMTSFGPAAFAYRVAPDPTAANQAGAASIGLTDTDPSEPDTQGATAVTAGGTGQTMGEVKFVLPSKWQIGDTIDFQVGPSGDLTGAAVTGRVSFSSKPAIAIAPQAYSETTHIEDANTTPGGAPGEVNGGALTNYTPTGSETPAKAPQFDVQLISAGGGQYQNVARIVFTNDSDPLANRAKFIGTLNGSIDVGTTVTGAIPLAATGVDTAGTLDNGTLEFLGMAAAAGTRNTTYPAAVMGATLTVDNGGITADDSDQYVGPITVAAGPGADLDDTASDVTVEFAPGTTGAALTGTATAMFYDVTGKLLGTKTDVATTGNELTVSAADIPDNTTKVVFSQVLVNSTTNAGTVSYNLTASGGAPATSGPLGASDATVHQIDIAAPSNSTTANASSSALPVRLGGLDRYQTAVKIAERSLAELGGGPGTGENDNVVIASGESFPDALSSGYLAATKDAQIILTRQGSLPQTDIEFLKNYGAKNVYIVGGEGAVGSAVEDQLRNLQSYDVQSKDGTTPDEDAAGDNRRVVPLEAKVTVLRLAGSDRFATNRRVNEYAGATSVNPIGVTTPKYGEANKKTVILANGMTPWDALAAGPLVGNSAGRNPIPVVLTAGSALNSNAKTQMQTLDAEASIMVGGTGVLPDSLMGEMDGLGVYSTRLAGSDRWGTAKAIAEFALRSAAGNPTTNQYPGLGWAALGANQPILANGGSMNGSYTANNAPNMWADALASGPFAAQTQKIIALTDSRSLPGTTKDLLSANKAALRVSAIAVGLGDVVATEVVKAANDAIAS